jgi:hypothetical protein
MEMREDIVSAAESDSQVTQAIKRQSRTCLANIDPNAEIDNRSEHCQASEKARNPSPAVDCEIIHSQIRS